MTTLDQSKEERRREANLVEAADQLHEAQTPIRDKDEALERDKTTVQNLEELDAEIYGALPKSAREELPPSMNPLAVAPELSRGFTAHTSHRKRPAIHLT